MRYAAGVFVAIEVLHSAAGFAPGAIQVQSVCSASNPTLVTPASDGSNRLFIVEQGGFIRVLQPGSSTPTLFLNVSALLFSPAGNEQGLLGLAFHPRYAINGRFFIYYTRAGDMALQISEYHVSGNPNVADTAQTPLLTIPHPTNQNHNGGNLVFGPDGYLYMGTGDGGSGNDPPNNAQTITVLLGKFLRIDVDSAAPYAIPVDNPYAGATPGADEIFCIGMRNPWRWSFDRGGTHGLYCGDVGQDAYEEIDLIELGKNYGWRVFEGFHCTGNDATLCTTTPSPYTSPLAEYPQTPSRCSITGGYIYRGYRATFPGGAYIYADYCTAEIFQFNPPVAGGAQTLLLDAGSNLTSFGQDEAGELYACLRASGVWRIVTNPAPAACSYSLTTSSASFGSAGGSGSLTINAGPDCGWTAAGHATWITLNLTPTFGQSSPFGVGTQMIGYTVGANSGAARSGTIQVGGKVFTVNQAAAVSVANWRSVRSHDGSGNLSIALDSSASGNGPNGPTVEPRSGGLQRIEIGFSGSITLADPSKVSVTGYNDSNPGGASYPPSGVAAVDADTLAITFPASPIAGALPDATCYVIHLLPGLLSDTTIGDQDVVIRALQGDTTSSGNVTLSDAIWTSLKIGVSSTAEPQFDLDLSGGSITLPDALLAKNQVTTPARQVLCP